MSSDTLTSSIETETAPEVVIEVLTDPRLIPRWAPGFADRVEAEEQGHWKVTKGEKTLYLEVVVFRSAGTVDYLREVAPGKKGGAYIRVLPRPRGGSVVVLTLPIPNDVSAEETASTLYQELRLLKELCDSRTLEGATPEGKF
jgi:hypothetical protein